MFSILKRSINNWEEKDIIREINNWNIEKYSFIVEKYEKKLLSYILKKTSLSLEDAENLLQDIFIKVYENINSYNEDYTFNSWIYKITYNYLVDNYKKEKNKKLKTDSLDEILWNTENLSLLNFLEDKNQNIENNLHKKELFKILIKSLNEIDEKYKDVLVLKYFENLKYSEISDILKISINTIKTLVSRWQKKLKQQSIKNNIQKYL